MSCHRLYQRKGFNKNQIKESGIAEEEILKVGGKLRAINRKCYSTYQATALLKKYSVFLQMDYKSVH